MIYIWLNLGPIIIAMTAGLAIGYGWLRVSKLRFSNRLLLVAIPAKFWLTSILAGALILAPPQADPWIMAMGSAFIIWIGFVLPVLVVTLSVRSERFAAIASASGYWLVAMMVQAGIMQTIGLTAPPVA